MRIAIHVSPNPNLFEFKLVKGFEFHLARFNGLEIVTQLLACL